MFSSGCKSADRGGDQLVLSGVADDAGLLGEFYNFHSRADPEDVVDLDDVLLDGRW